MRIVAFFMSLFVTTAVMAASSPFGPDLDKALKKLQNKQVARVVYDVATDSGAVGAHGLKVWLPSKAVITRSYYYVVTQFTDSGVGTVALSCEDANNILTARDITGFSAGAIQDGNESGVASVMVNSIASPCEIKATVASVEQLTGKLIAWIEYVVAE